MNRKLTFRVLWDNIKYYWVVLLVGTIALTVGWHFAFVGIDSYKNFEVVTFAIECFSHHETPFQDDLLEHSKQDGILDVFFSYVDAQSDPTAYSNLTDYLATFATHDADFFILDLATCDNFMAPVCTFFDENQKAQLNEAAGFDLKFIVREERTIGFKIYDVEDQEYNAKFKMVNDWLLFKTSTEVYDFGIYWNVNSALKEGVPMKVLTYFLTYNKNYQSK